MVASLVPVSTGHPMTFTKDEATAAQATWTFYLSNTADGTPATGKTIAGADFKISKNGAAFGNAAGAVTEMSLGWYKMVFAAADLDTLGALACELAVEAGVDPLRVTHQVRLLDQNIATVPLAADALGSSQLAATAVTELQAGLATAAAVDSITLATRTVTIDLGRMEVDGHANTNGDFVAISILEAIDATVNISGTWNGATATVFTTNDPAATVPVWTEYDDTGNDNPLTADGSVIVVGGAISAVKVEITNDGASTDLGVSVSIRKPANT